MWPPLSAISRSNLVRKLLQTFCRPYLLSLTFVRCSWKFWVHLRCCSVSWKPHIQCASTSWSRGGSNLVTMWAKSIWILHSLRRVCRSSVLLENVIWLLNNLLDPCKKLWSLKLIDKLQKLAYSPVHNKIEASYSFRCYDTQYHNWGWILGC